MASSVARWLYERFGKITVRRQSGVDVADKVDHTISRSDQVRSNVPFQAVMIEVKILSF